MLWQIVDGGVVSIAARMDGATHVDSDQRQIKRREKCDDGTEDRK